MSPRPARAWRRFVVGAVVGAAVATGAAGCTSARDTLGTNSSPCFRALALAADAVHERGTFSGVRLVSASMLVRFHLLDRVLAERSSARLHNVCLVSYRGSFRPDQVQRPAGKVPASGVGHFAIAVVSTPQNVLLATVVLEHQPVRFLHLALSGQHAAASGGRSESG
jgi:hypothetical protein